MSQLTAAQRAALLADEHTLPRIESLIRAMILVSWAERATGRRERIAGRLATVRRLRALAAHIESPSRGR